ncbi:hypothetical protein NPX13_g4768 [Xylaria arbuscula]|uniref:RRM domain-containing protein n=1 Tax=Xylaria arbuscula TaxID=114810 RepID=A0A9W8TNS5_9PEZI|nr:hypothetical protein NPX13_g4768 [Xylaria arbuscula]
MAPKYLLYSDFTIDDALERAGSPPSNDQYLANEPPICFFEQPPKDHAAVFSTYNGQRPFRFVKDPTYERPGSYWWAAQIQTTCDGLRRNMPDICRNIEHPRDYWDLYKYFDAQDIYERGARNLFNVVTTLVWENNYVRQCVEQEQKMQTEQHTLLFEVLSVKMMKRPGFWNRLLKWNEEKQPDILQVFGTRDLEASFTDFNKYPEHFRQAIRVIMRKHYDSVHLGTPAVGPGSAIIPTINVKDRLNALRSHLENAPVDPFMDKFDISNKIVNRVVVVDGTSQTAAWKAGYNRPSFGSTHNPKIHEGIHTDGIREPCPSMGSSTLNISPSCENIEPNRLAVVSETVRCSSAPRMGTSPSKPSKDVGTHQPRVHTSNGFKTGEKPIVCPIYDEYALNETPIAVDTVGVAQTAMHAPNSHLPQLPPPLNTVLPLHPSNGGPRYHQDSSVQQPTTLPPAFVPGPIAPGSFPDHRDHGMSQSAFVHQFPTYALSQQSIQGPPTMMQQSHFPAPTHIRTNGGGNNMNCTSPYIQTEARPYYNAPPAAHTNSLGTSAQNNRKSSTQSTGKWHQVGSDNIHGPKVIYRKDTVSDETRNINRGNQWQGKEPHHADRRTSTTSNAGGHRRFSNNRPQNYNSYADPHLAENGVGRTGYKARTSTSASQLFRDYGCANANKSPNVCTKFDACPCDRCSERDRTIFVNRFEDGVLKTEGAEDRLRKHFSKFGEVQRVYFPEHNHNCVYIRFANSLSTIDAVRLKPKAQIEGLGSTPAQVDFRTGSQYFMPKPPKNFQGSGDYGYFAQNPAQVQSPTMPQPPIGTPNSFNTHAQPLHQPLQHNAHLPPKPVTIPGTMVHPGHLTSMPATADCALDVLDRRASQSGFGKREYPKRNSVTASSNATPASPRQPVPVDPIRTSESHESIKGSELNGAAEIFVNDTSSLPQEPLMSRQTSSQGTPKTPQSTDEAPLVVPLPVTKMDSSSQLPEEKGITEAQKEADNGDGTVRVRPEKAQYVPVPSDWHRDNRPLPSQNDNPNDAQQVQVTTETSTAELSIESGEKQPSLDEQLSINSLRKRKAGRSDKCEEATAQLSPIEPPAKVARPDEAVSEQHQIEQPGIHEEQASKSTNGRKKSNKNKNKNKRHQDQELMPTDPSASSTTHQTQQFLPSLTTSHLPQYSNQVGPGMGVEKPNIPPTLESTIACMPPVTTATVRSDKEPFPAYQDIMSSPTLATHEHQRYDSKWSFSSDEVAVTRKPIEKSQGLNPVAQDFVPLSPNTIAEKTAVRIDTKAPTAAPSIPPVNDDLADDGEDDSAHKLTSKEHSWGRSNSGSKSYYSGKGKYHNKKGSRYHRKSTSTNGQASIVSTPRADPKLDPSQPSGSGDATSSSKKTPFPTEQKVESPNKSETLKDENSEPGSSVGTQPKEFLVSSSPDNIKADEQEKWEKFKDAQMDFSITTTFNPDLLFNKIEAENLLKSLESKKEPSSPRKEASLPISPTSKPTTENPSNVATSTAGAAAEAAPTNKSKKGKKNGNNKNRQAQNKAAAAASPDSPANDSKKGQNNLSPTNRSR